jgi:hypothetical protein
MEKTEKTYYVTMTDSFMSGWGKARGGKINKLIFPCKTYEEAEIVADNADNRTDQRYVDICSKKPYFSPSKYFVQVKTKEMYPNWYVKGYFKKS